MKSTLIAALIYLCLSILVISCKEHAPAPTCIKAEVVGNDCEEGWYILKLEEKNYLQDETNGYRGMIQGGFVTTDNLPEQYHMPGTKLDLSVELNGEYSPQCMTTAIMYPAVRVTKVCSSGGTSTPKRAL